MLNQPKPYQPKQNAVRDLVNFETQVNQVAVESAVQVELAVDGKTIRFIHKGMTFSGKTERPLVHQLGGRAWKICNRDFSSIEKIWRNKFAADKAGLEAELAAVFRQHDLSIRYFHSNGTNQVYGIVSPYFLDVNQLSFRQQFLEQAQQHTSFMPQSRGIQRLSTGEVVEQFSFEATGLQTEYLYGLNYAKNNGYNAYKVHWGRMVLICSNGLKDWRGTKYNWKHTREIDLADFINNTVQEGVGHQLWLERKISESQGKMLEHDTLRELYSRLSMAKATKDRVHNQLAVESKQVGHNEWALSQALTYLGSHEKLIPFRVKRQLTGLGTELLERSVDSVLEGASGPNYDGYYGLLLPKSFKTAA